MKKLIDKIYKEYQEKLRDPSVENVMRLMIYAMFITYITSETIDESYGKMLLAQDNTLDYLYDAYIENNHVLYKDVKDALDRDVLNKKEK